MKKILLIIALTLLWSFNVNAQTLNQVKLDDNCTTSLSADEAYKSTADGNVNTFSATYSTVTKRNCTNLKVAEKIGSGAIAAPINIGPKLIEERPKR